LRRFYPEGIESFSPALLFHGHAGFSFHQILTTLKGLNQTGKKNVTSGICGIDATLSGLMVLWNRLPGVAAGRQRRAE